MKGLIKRAAEERCRRRYGKGQTNTRTHTRDNNNYFQSFYSSGFANVWQPVLNILFFVITVGLKSSVEHDCHDRLFVRCYVLDQRDALTRFIRECKLFSFHVSVCEYHVTLCRFNYRLNKLNNLKNF